MGARPPGRQDTASVAGTIRPVPCSRSASAPDARDVSVARDSVHATAPACWSGTIGGGRPAGPSGGARSRLPSPCPPCPSATTVASHSALMAARQASPSISAPAARSARRRFGPPWSAHSRVAVSANRLCCSVSNRSKANPLKSARQPEHPFGDDVALNLDRAAADRHPPHLEHLRRRLDEVIAERHVPSFDPVYPGSLDHQL